MLDDALIDQSEVIFCLALSTSERDLYQPQIPLFGREVDDKLSGMAEDIGEAAKCLSVHRYTACVFHLMRAMEGAVQRLSESLSITNPSREWGKLLSDIKPKIAAMQTGEMRNKWSENFALLYHVKQAWRNDTMHPKQTYTEEEAKEVFSATRSFMKNLAALV